MIEIIDVTKLKHIHKLNAAAKQAHDHPKTHGLLVKIYADWCGHCQNMKADWKRLVTDLTTNYKCKTPGCVLTIANIRASDLGPNDPILNNIKYIPKDIQSIPTIMYISKGMRGLEYSNERIYSEMLKWVVNHPDFTLVRKENALTHSHDSVNSHHHGVLKSMTKKARIKFKEVRRETLKRFHKEMRRLHKKSVKMRMATPVAPGAAAMRGYIPAYLRE